MVDWKFQPSTQSENMMVAERISKTDLHKHKGSNKLSRPRSVDDLLDCSTAKTTYSNTSRCTKNNKRDGGQTLEDLDESEVFVGSDEEEDASAYDSHTSLTISYHEEPRVPLHAVKEEVEAEAAEEAAMSLQMSSCSDIPLHSSRNHPYGMEASGSQHSMNHLGTHRFVHGMFSNMSRSVDMNNLMNVDGNFYKSLDTMSKSAELLDDDSSRVSNSIQYVKDYDLTEGLPSLDDNSGSLGDEGISNSPFQESSPLSNSLASSLASNMSFDDTLSSKTDTSSFTDTLDTVKSSCLKPETSKNSRENISKSSTGHKNCKNPKAVSRNNGKIIRCSATRCVEGAPSVRNSQNGSSKSSNRNNSRVSSRCDDRLRNIKTPSHDRRTCRSNLISSTVASRSKMADIENKRKGSQSKFDAKDRLSDSKYKAVETKNKSKLDEDYETSTLGRRKKKSTDDNMYSWRNDHKAIETYGTLGRKKKVREAGDGREDVSSSGGLTKENKDTLDTYATLPRRKAKEMTARWREQNLKEHTDFHPTVPHLNIQPPEMLSKSRPLRRSRSIGKGDSTRISSYANNPTPRSSTNSRTSPRVSHPSPRTGLSSSSQTPRKERTIICLEASIQTAILGHEVAAAMRALAKVGPNLNGDDVSRPRVEIVRDYEPVSSFRPSRKPLTSNAVVQADSSVLTCKCSGSSATYENSEELHRLLKEEQLAKEEVQDELDRTTRKIKDMLSSMEGVEQEFNERHESLVVLENQLQHSTQFNTKLQDTLSLYEQYAVAAKRDLAESEERVALLTQQVSDLENESRELAEFMTSEKEALAECLRESETENVRLREENEEAKMLLESKEQEKILAEKIAEEKRMELDSLSQSLVTLQGNTRDQMVCQGAQVSSAAVTLSNLAIRLQALTNRIVNDYEVTEQDLKNIVTPSESDSSCCSSASVSPQHIKRGCLPPSRLLKRSPTSFIHAVLLALKGGSRNEADIGNEIVTVTPFASSGDADREVGTCNKEGKTERSGSLVDQVREVDEMLSRFLKVCCVLKNGTDLTMDETADDNDRLSQEVRSQQSLIETLQSEVEVMSRNEAKLRREIQSLGHSKVSSPVSSSSGLDIANIAETLKNLPSEVISSDATLYSLVKSLRSSNLEDLKPLSKKNSVANHTSPIASPLTEKIPNGGISKTDTNKTQDESAVMLSNSNFDQNANPPPAYPPPPPPMMDTPISPPCIIGPTSLPRIIGVGPESHL